jgi:hypothetical protein
MERKDVYKKNKPKPFGIYLVKRVAMASINGNFMMRPGATIHKQEWT